MNEGKWIEFHRETKCHTNQIRSGGLDSVLNNAIHPVYPARHEGNLNAIFQNV
jgi:hypothetical protein